MVEKRIENEKLGIAKEPVRSFLLVVMGLH